MSSGSSVFSTPTPREVADEQLARALAGFRDLWSNWLRDAGSDERGLGPVCGCVPGACLFVRVVTALHYVVHASGASAA